MTDHSVTGQPGIQTAAPAAAGDLVVYAGVPRSYDDHIHAAQPGLCVHGGPYPIVWDDTARDIWYAPRDDLKVVAHATYIPTDLAAVGGAA